MHQRKNLILTFVVLVFLFALPVFASYHHDCCDYDGNCPGYWWDNHDFETEMGGCTNEGDTSAAGHCTIGNKVSDVSCNSTGNCYTWFGEVSCAGDHCYADGKLFCSGSSGITFQHYSIECSGGSHGGPQTSTPLSTAHCNDDAGYGTHHECTCNASGGSTASCT